MKNMRFDNYLDELLTKRSHVKLLRVLVLSSLTKEWSGREIARAAGIDHTVANDSLHHFNDYGIVSMRRLGNANVYRVNADHLAVRQLRDIFEAEQQAKEKLKTKLAKACASSKNILSATIYDDVARGRDKASSDIDLLVIVNEKVDLTGLFSGVKTELGNTVSPHVWTLKQLRRRRKLPLMRNIVKDGEHVCGEKLENLLWGYQRERMKPNKGRLLPLVLAGLLLIVIFLCMVSAPVSVTSAIGASDATGDLLADGASGASPSSEAQIWTGDAEGNLKVDFGPEEMVYICGSGFSVNAQIGISITRPDLTVFQGSTFSDDNGDFVYSHLLDGITGTYTVTATDGTNTTTTTFTDAKIKIKTYKDSACTILETVFYQGETVYAKATGLKSDKYYKFVWVNPSGDNVKQMVYENGATSRTDNYPLPSDASIGTWHVKIFERISSSWPWTFKCAATFHVWHSITPTADSWVELTKPNTNEGDDKILHVKVDWDEEDDDEGEGVATNLRRSYLKFDLSGLPPGAMITSAKLHLHLAKRHLYRKTHEEDVPSVYRTTDNWTENGITWNNQLGPGALENDNGAVSGNWVEWGITSYAASEYAGDKVLSVVLKFKTESGPDQHADFTSREGRWNRRPWLEISYHVAAWQVVESWTGTVKASAAAWWPIETWTGTVSAPAQWQVIETWSGTVTAPSAWSVVETWTGTVGAPVAWQVIETWTGTVSALIQWQVVETWTGIVSAPAQWQLIETWTGTVSAPVVQWQVIETWTGTVRTPAAWQVIETWTGTIEAPVVAWQLIETWTGTVEAPIAWQLMETWVGTIEAPVLAWPFGFSVSASPDTLILTHGENISSTISVSLISGEGEVSLSGAWMGTAPTAISTVFSPQLDTPPFNSTLTFTAFLTASGGTFIYEVTGSGGGLTRTDTITLMLPPAAPSLVSPRNGTTINIITPTFDWKDVTGAASYTLQVATDDSFLYPVFSTDVIESTAASPASLSYGTRYYWRVRAKNNVGAGDWSSTWNFIAKLSPPKVLSFEIETETQYTNSTSVELTISAQNAVEMSFSSDGVVWGEWEPYQTPKSYTLSGSDGPKNIYIRVRDDVGGISQMVLDSIILDQTQPSTIHLLSGELGTEGYKSSVMVTLTSTDTYGVESTEYRVDNGEWRTGHTFVVSGEGKHTIEYYSTDKAGNVEEIKSFEVAVYTPTIIPDVEPYEGIPNFLYLTGSAILITLGVVFFRFASMEEVEGDIFGRPRDLEGGEIGRLVGVGMVVCGLLILLGLL